MPFRGARALLFWHTRRFPAFLTALPPLELFSLEEKAACVAGRPFRFARAIHSKRRHLAALQKAEYVAKKKNTLLNEEQRVRVRTVWRLLQRARYIGEHVVGIAANQTNGSHHDHENDRQHDRVLGDVLTFILRPHLAQKL